MVERFVTEDSGGHHSQGASRSREAEISPWEVGKAGRALPYRNEFRPRIKTTSCNILSL
jgi:hypothetical protein